MLTDAPPHNANRARFLESDRIKTLNLPQDGRWSSITESIESALKAGQNADIRRACVAFLQAASDFYDVPHCGVRVLAARSSDSTTHGTLADSTSERPALPSCSRDTAEATVLGANVWRTVADRLAAHEPGCVISDNASPVQPYYPEPSDLAYEEFCCPFSAGGSSRLSSVMTTVCFHLR
jgi:hypothetical protein